MKGSIAGYSVICVGFFFPLLQGLKYRKISNHMLGKIDVSVRILVHSMQFYL